jgi:hypothetical protein
MAKAQQPALQKVLRIGVIQDGKIVQERLVRAGESVSVGESASATFMLPNMKLPPEFTLFEHRDRGYVLRFSEAMKGKISGASGTVAAIERLRAEGSATKEGNDWTLPLSEEDRGKISIGEVTVLFQFVAPPPTQAVRPIEAMDFRPKFIEEDDPVFFGFLALWSAVAAVFAIWITTAEPPPASTVVEIPDRFLKITVKDKEPPPPEPELEVEDPNLTRPVESETGPAKAKKENETKREAAARKEGVEKDLRRNNMLLKMIGSRGEGRGVTENLWADDDAGMNDIDAALEGANGVAIASTDNRGLRGGNTEGTEGSADIGALGSAGGGSAEVGAGPAVKVSGDVAVGAADFRDVSSQDSVKDVVTRNFGQLKYCYETRLKEDPSLSGRVEIEMQVRGERVTSTNVFANTTGDAEFAACIEGKIRRWKFPAEVEGDFLYPFIFTPKK